jgi:hypothetical protein
MMMDKNGAMLPLASSQRHDFIAIGATGDRRVNLFQEALAGLGLPVAYLVSYQDLIAGHVSLADVITPTSIVRIESPGKNCEVEHALLGLGAEVEDPDGEIYERMSRKVIETMDFES